MPAMDARRPASVTRFLPTNAPSTLIVTVVAAENFVHHEMTTYAAALAYRGLLALFPFIIFVTALANTLDIWQPFGMLDQWARAVPEGRVPTAIKAWMVLQSHERAHKAVLSMGAIAAVWAVATGARVLRRALNIAGNIPEGKPLWARLAISLIVAPMLCVVLVMIVLLFTATRDLVLQAASWFQINGSIVELWDWIRLPTGVALAVALISGTYKFGSSEPRPLRTLLPGAVIAALMLAAASSIFTHAVASVLRFGITYGGFSAAIMLLVYLYLSAGGLLFGAELNAALLAARHLRPASPLDER